MDTQTVVVQTKKWYQSKVIWMNLATAILGITGAITPDILNAAGITSKQFMGGLGLLNVILNTVLRITTTSAPIQGGGATTTP